MFGRSNRTPRQGERGATAVEYGMIAAVFVGASGLLLGALVDTSSEAVEVRGDRIGNPDDAVVIADPGGDTGGTVGGDIPTDEAPTIGVHLADLVDRGSKDLDPKWQASVDVAVGRAGVGDAPVGVSVFGQWRIVTKGGKTNISTVVCTTDVAGSCTMTIGSLKLTGGSTADTEAHFEFDRLEVDPNIYAYDAASDTTAFGDPPAVLVCSPATTKTVQGGIEVCL